MINDFIPGLDIISTFFTIAYLGWLISREFRGAWVPHSWGTQYSSGIQSLDGSHSIKRSLLNQHICR